jgi:hypothetical protein
MVHYEPAGIAPFDTVSNLFSRRPSVIWHGDAPAIVKRRELVRGLIESACQVVLIAGTSGSGKTFNAINLAGALAAGGQFFGHQVAEPGGSLFVLAEGIGTIAERIEAVRADGIMDGAALPIAWMALSGSLSVEAEQNSLIAEAKRVADEMPAKHGVPLRLIVVDTIAAAFTLKDENDAGEATRAMQFLQALNVATGALVVGITHYGKSAETGVRGSSAFTASADAILAINADRDPTTGKVKSRTISLTKSRWRDTGWTAGFELQPIVIGQDEEGEDVLSCVVRPGAAVAAKASAERGWSRALRLFRDAVIEAIIDHGRDRQVGLDGPKVRAARVEDVRPIFYRRYATGEGIGDKSAKAKRSALRSALGSAIRQKLVISDTHGDEEWLWLP